MIAPAEDGSAYITRVDNTDLAFSYAGEWEHNTMSSFKNYKRTLSTGKEGSSFTVDFNGTGIALTGGGSGATITWSVDGGDAQEYTFGKNSVRKANFLLDGLADGAHTLSVTVVDGKYTSTARRSPAARYTPQSRSTTPPAYSRLPGSPPRPGKPLLRRSSPLLTAPPTWIPTARADSRQALL